MTAPGGPAAPPGDDPLERVREWYDAARAAGVPEPEAAALATATPASWLSGPCSSASVSP